MKNSKNAEEIIVQTILKMIYTCEIIVYMCIDTWYAWIIYIYIYMSYIIHEMIPTDRKWKHMMHD